MKTYNGQTRIIAGKWRSRKLTFAANGCVRPTPNRVRETLFNWLTPYIQNAICLDAFAGSGALGFEALSRGAKHVVMIDNSRHVVNDLKKNAASLTVTNLDIVHDSFPSHTGLNCKFDIIFLDPPYHQNLIAPCCAWLEKNHYLAENALIYAEMEKDLKTLSMPANWQIVKKQINGQVGCYLLSTGKFYTKNQ